MPRLWLSSRRHRFKAIWRRTAIFCAPWPLANATLVLTKTNIEAPRERIFHTPVVPHGLGEPHSITGQGGQEQALRDRDLAAHFALRLDQANTGDIGPRALHASARNIRRAPIVTGLQATMIRGNGHMVCRGAAVQPRRF